MPKKAIRTAMPSFHLSQNFLTSERTIERLLALSNIHPMDSVIEIGPGKGHITDALLSCGARVTAVEVDLSLCARLNERFGGVQGFRLIRGDFLTYKLPVQPYKVFANIPFSRTTDIIKKLSDCPPEDAWLIVERGAAKGFSGMPRESLQSLMVKPVFDVAIAARVPRGEFHPTPSVDAALLHLGKKRTPDIYPSQMNAYRRFIEQSFRKGLRSTFTNRQLATALKRVGVLPESSMGDILYTQWLCLFRCSQLYGKV